MHADDCVVDVFYVLAQVRDEGGVLLRHGVADGVGNIDRGGSGLDGGLHDTSQELGFRARGILRRKLDILHQCLGAFHAFDRQTNDLFFGLFQFELAVNGGGGQEDVNSREIASRLHGGSRCIDILGDTSSQPADDRSLDFGGDRSHRFEIAVADHRKTGFDHIDVEASQLAGDFHLLAQVHAGAGALFAVAQRRIKNRDFVRHRMSAFFRRKVRKGVAALTAPAGNAAYAVL